MARKILFSFFLSVVLCAGIVVLAPAGMLMVLVAVFLTLFLIIFFCFNMRQDSTGENKPVIHNYIPEALEELEAAEDAPLIDDVPEQAMTVSPARTSNVRIAFGDDDIPYLVESSGLELVDEELEELEAVSPFSSMLPLLDAEANDDAVELESVFAESGGSISILRQPFAFSQGNPELLQGTAQDVRRDVLYQKNGIHYISSDVFDSDKNTERNLNNDFVKLVESVVNKCE